MMRRISMTAAVALLVAIGPAVSETPAPGSADTFKSLNLFAEAFERVRKDYVEPVPDDQLVEDAIGGMLSSLDPHSSYMNASAFKDMQVQTRGEFGGLGIEVIGDPSGAIKIVAPIDDTPGARAGLKSGDLIVAIDGVSLATMTANDAIEKMRGSPGTQVKLTIRRPGEAQPLDMTLTRAIIHVASVKSRLERDNIAYIRLAQFQEQSGTEVETAFKTLKAQAGGKLVGVVLDLRSDPGGLLDQAVAVSSEFLDHGEVVSTRGRHPDDVQRYNAHGGDMTNGLPVVVLIDGGTASASEVVAGALQDHHRAVILGTRSFGKGSVQTIIPLPGNGAMRLTTARYFTPSGRSIQAKGIDPDITVEPAKIQTIAMGERLHEADLKGALKNPDQAAAKPADAKPATPDPAGKDATAPKDAAPPAATGADVAAAANTSQVSEDYQLSRALDLLKGLSMFNKAVD
jgi:carboxyl-terminal processing protease